MSKSMSTKSVRTFRPSVLRASNIETKINEKPIERLSVIEKTIENKERPTLADRSQNFSNILCPYCYRSFC